MHSNWATCARRTCSIFARLIRLLKVLPRYDYQRRKRMDPFWEEFCAHLGYPDPYPATKISGHLDLISTSGKWGVTTDLAEYTLMFFDPDDEHTLRLLAERGQIGPGVAVARRWCRDVTDAAWTLHRATMTSYPRQVGQLYMEAGDSDNPERIAELCHSVYEEVRARAFMHAPVTDQLHALKQDPSEEVLYTVASEGDHTVQELAATLPRAWNGLARNTALRPEMANQLVTNVLAELRGAQAHHAERALLDLTERTDLPRPLLEHISTEIDTPEIVHDDATPGAVISAVFNIRSTLQHLDQADEKADHTAQQRREQFRLVTEPPRPSWWRRFQQ